MDFTINPECRSTWPSHVLDYSIRCEACVKVSRRGYCVAFQPWYCPSSSASCLVHRLGHCTSAVTYTAICCIGVYVGCRSIPCACPNQSCTSQWRQCRKDSYPIRLTPTLVYSEVLVMSAFQRISAATNNAGAMFSLSTGLSFPVSGSSF
jgi:hypothetical protein